MFSKRLPSSMALNEIARALERDRARGRSILDLTETNPTAVGLDYPEGEIFTALADPRALVYRPTPHGLDEARAAVAADYARRGAAVDAAHVWLTASTSEAYAQLFKLLCDPGDRVLVPRPSYPLFDLLAGLEAVEPVPYSLHYHAGWYADCGELERAADERTRAVLVVNPNNPTGSFLKRDELASLEALCEARGLALISDEVFADYGRGTAGDRVTTVAGERRALTFSLGGLSKSAGLPQLKLGWIVASGPPALVAEAEARLELILDTFLSVNQPVQHAAPRLLGIARDMAARIGERVEQNRARVAQAVRGTSLQLLDAEGGWSAVLRVPRVAGEEQLVLTLLEEDGVLVQPGYFFDFADEAYLILSLLLPAPIFDEGVARVVTRIERLTNG
jgi:aspartate/methionine/tyrosine aminotransferase